MAIPVIGLEGNSKASASRVSLAMAKPRLFISTCMAYRYIISGQPAETLSFEWLCGFHVRLLVSKTPASDGLIRWPEYLHIPILDDPAASLFCLSFNPQKLAWSWGVIIPCKDGQQDHGTTQLSPPHFCTTSRPYMAWLSILFLSHLWGGEAGGWLWLPESNQLGIIPTNYHRE